MDDPKDVKKVTPREAANEIRYDFTNEPLEPGFLHKVRFAEQVCDELQIERSHGNTQRVLALLDKHNIDGSAYEAFPGWFDNDAGERAMCVDEDHRDAFMDRANHRNEDGTIAPEAGTVDAHGKFHMGRRPGVWKKDIRATMPRYGDEHDIREVTSIENQNAPLHRIHDLGKGEPIHQPTDNLPDPDSLMMNPPNPIDPTHDNRRPGDNPASPVLEVDEDHRVIADRSVETRKEQERRKQNELAFKQNADMTT